MGMPSPATRRSLAAITVLAGHLGLLWVVATGVRSVEGVKGPPWLSLVLIHPASTPDEPRPSERAAAPTLSARRTRPAQVAPEDASKGPVSEAVAAPRIDWSAEAERVGAASAKTPSIGRSFGMPEPAEAPPKPRPSFGWSLSATRPVEAIPGGILFRIGDNCEIVLMPLPVGACAIGKRKANGALFGHMEDPVPLGEWKDAH